MYLSTEDLLDEPFGPLEEIHLSPRAPKRLELNSVVMCQNHEDADFPSQSLGLDTTEYILPPSDPGNPVQEDMHSEVLVTGVFELAKLDWLSDKGQEVLVNLMRRRDDEYRNPGDPKSTITLRSFFVSPELTARVKIKISFVKNMLATYSFKDKDTDGERYVNLKSKFRLEQNYTIISMKADCYFKSLNWCNRYQLYYLMKDLAAKGGGEIEERTIEWFIKEYKGRYLEGDKKRRIIFRYDTNDINIESDGTVNKKRFLRHISSADIRGRFAEHCEWLLAHQIASSSTNTQVFNLSEWIKFCDQVKVWRKKARDLDGERWGIAWNTPEDLVFPPDDRYFLQRFGGSAAEWNKKLSLALKRKPPKQKRPAPDPEVIPDYEAPRSSKRRRVVKAAQCIYDSDFSEDSTEGESDAELQEHETVTVPTFCLQRPSLSAGNLKWFCPGSSCSFEIDLIQLGKSRRVSTFTKGEGLRVFHETVQEHYFKEHIPVVVEPIDSRRYILRNKGDPRVSHNPRRRIKTEEDSQEWL